MKILFVAQYAPHRDKNIPIHVQNQMEQLISFGVDVIPFPYKQNGMKNKIKSFLNLRRYLKKNSFDIIHCHYGYIGLAGLFASQKKNVIVSFMGTDIENILRDESGIKVGISNILTKLLIRKSTGLKGIISKNERHYNYLKKKINCPMINLPNGVDLKIFKPGNKKDAREKLNIAISTNLIILCSAKHDNPIKNIELAKRSINLLREKYEIDFRILSDLSQSKLLEYYIAADALLLTSLSEGSPNVIKEAMGCNLPIVATKVGDIPERLKSDYESELVDFDPQTIANAIEKKILKKTSSKGRELLKEDGIDVESTIVKLINFYNGK